VDTAPSYGTYKVKPVFENASGALVDGPNFATATVSTPDFDARIFRMHGPSGGGGTNCPNGGAVFPMAGTYVPGATTTTSTIGGAGTRFCSSTTEPAARTQGPGEIRAEIWMRNTDATTCSLTATLGFNAVAAKSVTVTATVPPNSYGPIRWSAQHSGFAVAAGDRAVAQFSADSQAQCAATTFNFGATATPSTLRLGGADALPAAPTGLTATPSASGLVLSWTAAADAQADWSYRIYRAGREHTQRIDRTADASTQHVVPDNTGSDQYWVTAVSPRLGESTHLGPVTG
jgi:hypothetical protein